VGRLTLPATNPTPTPSVSGPRYWETRAMCAAIELAETADPRMRAYLLTVAANAMEEVRAWGRVAEWKKERG
jgi:hypothetical protein